MLQLKDYIISCGTFDFTAMQHKTDYHFIIVNKRTQKATKTDDCIVAVAKNQDKYIWEDIA